MLRRPATEVELSLDDLSEYDEIRKERELRKTLFGGKTSKPENEVPKWQIGQKSTKEIYSRIGYNPPDSRRPSY